MKIYSETLPEATARLIEKIKLLPQLQQFYLTGGTTLSLQLGHRESEDLDFFSQTDFKPEILQRSLLKIGPLDSLQVEPYGCHYVLPVAPRSNFSMLLS